MFRDVEPLFNLGELSFASFAGLIETAPREEIANELGLLMDSLRDIDQQSADAIASYIRGCRDWKFHSHRKGRNNFHFQIDTCAANANGAITYIMIDHTLPIDKDGIEQNFAALYDKSQPLPEEVQENIVQGAENAVLIQYPAEVVAQLRQNAPDEISDIDLVRNDEKFWQQANVAFDDNNQPVLNTLFSAITVRVIPLTVVVKGVDAESLITASERHYARNRAEQVYHFEELRQVITMLRIGKNMQGDDLTFNDRRELRSRVEEIMGDITDWRYIHDQQEAFEAELLQDDEWSPEKGRVLLEMLLSNDVLTGSAELLSYIDKFSGLRQAAHTVMQLESTKKSVLLGSVASRTEAD